jgi:organic hydroperoxide reductase OsmC/OhrA
MSGETVHHYDIEVIWSDARRGIVRSPGLPEVAVAAPLEFKGHPGMWTPEHHFVAAVASCFMTTFLAVAEASKLEFAAFRCTGRGVLQKTGERGFVFTEVTLAPHVTIPRATDRERVLRILEKAERNCFVSSSIRAEVKLEPVVEIGEAAPAAAA